MTKTAAPVAEHRVIVDDIDRITACECGLQVFTRPGSNPLTNLFISEHEAMIFGKALA